MLNSNTFGMTFWLDNDNQLMYCPTQTNNQPDKSCSGYVCEWDEINSTDLDKLFYIHRHLIIQDAVTYQNKLTQKEAN